MIAHLSHRIAELFKGRFGERRSEPAASYEAVQQRVAEQLYRRALADGGWAAEIGPYGPALFQGEASERLRHIALGEASGGPPAP